MISNQFKLKGEHTLHEHITCQIYDYQNMSVLLYKINSLHEACISKFCQFHKSFVEHRKENLERKYVFIFDSSNFEMDETQGVADVLVKVKEKIQLHKSLSDFYEKQLVCSFIVLTNPIVKTLLNGIFGVFYTPTRPLKVIQPGDEMEPFITLHKSFNNAENLNTFIDNTNI